MDRFKNMRKSQFNHGQTAACRKQHTRNPSKSEKTHAAKLVRDQRDLANLAIIISDKTIFPW